MCMDQRKFMSVNASTPCHSFRDVRMYCVCVKACMRCRMYIPDERLAEVMTKVCCATAAAKTSQLVSSKIVSSTY